MRWYINWYGYHQPASHNHNHPTIQPFKSCTPHLLKLLGYTWRDRKSYAVLLSEIAKVGVTMYPVEVRIRMIQLKYFGHVQRMGNHRLPKIMLNCDVVAGQRTAGRPQLNYRQSLLKSLKVFGISRVCLQPGGCSNRDLWRQQLREGRDFFMFHWNAKQQASHIARRVAKAAREGAVEGVRPHQTERPGHDSELITPHRVSSLITTAAMQFDAVDKVVRAGHQITTMRGRKERAIPTAATEASKSSQIRTCSRTGCWILCFELFFMLHNPLSPLTRLNNNKNIGCWHNEQTSHHDATTTTTSSPLSMLSIAVWHRWWTPCWLKLCACVAIINQWSVLINLTSCGTGINHHGGQKIL